MLLRSNFAKYSAFVLKDVALFSHEQAGRELNGVLVYVVSDVTRSLHERSDPERRLLGEGCIMIELGAKDWILGLAHFCHGFFLLLIVLAANGKDIFFLSLCLMQRLLGPHWKAHVNFACREGSTIALDLRRER